MAELSPAAVAVLDAFFTGGWEDEPLHANIAAALRAAATQFFYDWNGMCCEEHLKAIAAELEDHGQA